MEIQPIIKYTLPKFALTLAAAAVAGNLTACTGNKPVVMGIAPQPVETDVVLMGDMPVVEHPKPTDEPDFSDAVAEANRSGEGYEKEIMEGFAERGITLEKDDSSTLWVWKSTTDPLVVVGFFDGNAESNGFRARDYMAEELEPSFDRQEWWGFVRVFPAAPDTPEMLACYIDITRCEGMTIEHAAQIAETIPGY